MADSQLTALETFLKDYPSIKYTPPSSPDYPSISKVWNLARQDNPLAIVHPQSAADVSAVIRYAKSSGIKFTIRTGGHNLQGRAIAEGALAIDMRALTSVKVAADRQSATVQGGILQQELATKLWQEGLATPTATIPSPGYVGWATYGGYGPFSARWGLGVDQIISATIVNANGAIVEADDSLLKGIRGAGGVFGVIVDLAIKVYPLESILAGVIVYDSQDISKTLTQFNAAYQKLLSDGVPLQLTIQQMAFNAPQGRMFAVSFMWSSDDIEQGQRWCEKIAALGPALMNTVALTTVPDWLAGNGALVPLSVYGSSRTHNLHQMTPDVVEIIGRNLAKMPSDPATMFSIHQLRGPSAAPNNESVFAAREPHFMLEILGYATAEEDRKGSEQWAVDLWSEVQQLDAGNVLPSAYIPLDFLEEPRQPGALSRLFRSHGQEILALKKKYDPENVFDLTVPRLKYYW
ncbi:hypothetical protein V1509DRAFT_635609 [Lipomyces kononenkoae]